MMKCQLFGIVSSMTLKEREEFANLLLKDVHLRSVLFGLNSVQLGDLIYFSSCAAPSAEGEFSYNGGFLKYRDASAVRTLLEANGGVAMTGDLNMGSHAITSVGNVDGVDVSAISLSSQPAAATGSIPCNSQRITGVGAPSADDDACTKGYVDAIAEGLSPKESVRVRAQGNVNLANELENGDTLDGVTLATGDRVLCDQQTTSSQDGIYVVVASGAAGRADDFAAGENAAGTFVFVCEGTDADAGFVCTNNKGSDVIGTDDLVFSQFSGAGAITAGDGLTKTGNTIDADNGAPNLTLGTVNAAGTDDTALMRVDASVAVFDGTSPTTIQCDDAAATGSAAFAARRDHKHAIVCAAPGTNITPEQANAEGSATSFARSDHMHNLPCGTPVAVDLAANAEGSAASFARSDHKHDLSEAIAPTWTGKHTWNVGSGNDAIMPSVDNQGQIGSHTDLGDGATKRWEQVVATTLKSGDVVLDNGWRITEVWKDGSIGPKKLNEKKESTGIAFMNSKGEQVFSIDEDGNMHIRGRVIQGE